LFLIALGGVAIAGGLGLAVAQTALAPVRRLTQTTEHVAETQDLSERIEVHGEDELSRLAASFNTMLAALEESARSQRQLVSDASHELRTPLTSLRTNIEVLARDRKMPDEEREKLLNDVVGQLSEMTALVTELVELARGGTHPEEAEDIRLDLSVGEVVGRAERDFPQVEFVTDLQPSGLYGVRSTIARAVSNLLDNAAKWSPPGAQVEVAVREGQVIVRDHGPGIDEDDLPYVFDRFYRAPAARKLPGSGLGLAIVKQVAEAHGGAGGAERAEGGGTLTRAAKVVCWITLTSRLTSGGSRRRKACGKTTWTWRPTQPNPSAEAASCCSRGIDSTAPRVASATWALPQRVRPIAAPTQGRKVRWKVVCGSAKTIRNSVTINGSPRQTSMYSRMTARNGRKR